MLDHLSIHSLSLPGQTLKILIVLTEEILESPLYQKLSPTNSKITKGVEKALGYQL